MIPIKQIYYLLDLKDEFFDKVLLREPQEKDMTEKIKNIGIDIEELMKEIKIVCDNGRLNVGGHLLCTKNNILPEYEQSNRLVLNADHLEGLGKILLVERGCIEDY